MERLIFRMEHDRYSDATNYLAVFPDAPAGPGRLAYAAFRLFEDGEAVFEPLGELSMGHGNSI